MIFQDKSIKCNGCGMMFNFSAVEQEYFQSRNYEDDPRLCLACRKKNQSEYNGIGSHVRERRTVTAKCALCGNEIVIASESVDENPVYCDYCCNLIRSN